MATERMFIATVSDINVVAIGALKRLAKLLDGTVVIVHKDNTTSLNIERITNEGDPSGVKEDQDVGQFSELFTIPSDQPGVSPGGLPQHQITKAEHQNIASKSLNHPGGGPIRFTRNPATGLIEETIDSRPKVRFVPTTIDLDIGDPSVILNVQLLNDDGTINTNFNGTRSIRIENDLKIRFEFADGVATKTIQTNKARHISITDNERFLVEEPFELDIADEL